MTEINIAVIGCGFMGSLYAMICHQMIGATVTAVCDVDYDRAKSLASQVDARAYDGDDYHAMFEAHATIDGVLICTPEDRHVAPAVAALEAGKHVMIEKPLATSLADGQQIIAAARGRNVISMVAYSLRFDPRYAAMKAAVDNDAVGEIIHMYARRNMPEAVIHRLNGRVEGPFWVGVHDIDMMRWLTGSNVARVMAVSSDKGMTDWDLETVYYALLTFEDGTVAALENAWSITPLTGRPQPFTFRVEGTKGQLQVRSYEQGITIHSVETIQEPDTVYMPEIYGRISGVYRDQITYFVDCIRDGKQTDIPIAEGWNGVQAAAAIVQSAVERREIVIEN